MSLSLAVVGTSGPARRVHGRAWARGSVLVRWIQIDRLVYRLMLVTTVLDLIAGITIITRSDGRVLGIAAGAFLLFVSAMRTCFARTLDPFAVIFFAWSMIFIEFPTAVVGFDPTMLQVDTGLAIELDTPTDARFATAMLELAACFLGTVGAIACVPIGRRHVWRPDRKAVRSMVVAALSLVTVSIIYDFTPSIRAGEFGAYARLFAEVIKFIALDTVVLTVLFLLLAERHHPVGRAGDRRMRWWITIFCGGVLLLSFSGSKGAILTLIFVSIVFPMALGSSLGRRWIAIPRLAPLLALAIIALPLFSYVSVLRGVRKSDPNAALVDSLARAADSGFDVGEVTEIVAQRLSIPFFRYLALHDRFGDASSADEQVRLAYFEYMAKSFANLMLPGTPFEECYAPSSSLLEPMLAGRELAGAGRDLYLVRLNSQPTTLFGVLGIAMSWMAPLGAFLATTLLRVLFRSPRPVIWFGALFAFHAALSSYGFEVSIQIAVSAGATFAILHGFGRRQERSIGNDRRRPLA